LATNEAAEMDGVSGAVSSSAIDLNPHQIQAAMFALNSPVSQGAILADEVGLGKTIEAGLVLSEYFLRGKQALIIVCPASLRKQWERELEDKFDIPTRLLDRTQFDYFRDQHKNPLDFKGCIICSYNFAAERKREIRDQSFDLVVVDEAHKLRNLYKEDTYIADRLFGAFENTKKLLLTATPIQNTLMDIFSLVSFIDPTIFGNKWAFQDNYLGSDGRHKDLRKRLESVLHRTLRRDVLEYIRYTNREAITIAFDPTFEESELYDLISEYIGRRSSYGIRTHFRFLIVLMIRKLMASSTSAVKGTLEGIRERLIGYQKRAQKAFNIANLIGDDSLIESYREEFENDSALESFKKEDVAGIEEEIQYLDGLIAKAAKIKVDGKTDKLIVGIEKGFAKIKENGGLRKAIIFTESQRTMEYLFDYLSKKGFKDKVITFSGSNNSKLCGKIYEEYKRKNPLALSGVKSADMRQALIDKFKNDAEIMIATEAGAEGLNLQFCSMLVNYDLPWNPQRVEQRIGRIHRYGQKHDVVIVNFINKCNAADQRLYDILQHKFKLFDGVFGASDEILGSLSDGVDFERAVGDIFQNCRTPEEIETAFDELQARLGEQKEQTINEAKQLILENLNPTIAEKLRVIKASVDKYLERRKDIFWRLTLDLLDPKMFVNHAERAFGPHDDQVFHKPSTINYAVNFGYKLDFSKKENRWLMLPNERRAEKLQPKPYNPTTEYGRRIVATGVDLPTEPAHLVSKMDGIQGSGLIRLSVYRRTAPTEATHLVTTFVSDGGSELSIDAGAFFDNIVEVGGFKTSGFKNFLDMFHDKKVKSISAKDKRAVEDMLKAEIEKLNRWAYEEKNSLKYQIKALEGRLLNVKRRFKGEKDLAAKVALGMEIEGIQKQISDLQLNTFEKQGATDKKAADLIAGRKRALKHSAEVEEIMLCSWEAA
jgi:superfamily II DNA or RNA helicase